MLTKISRQTSKIVFIGLLLIAAIAHGYNMFHFPYLENDEGTYMSQAWSVITQGKLAPYTYWYDHAPFGWILVAVWTALSGGFFTFGLSVNSGRVFMLVLHLVSVALVYFITKKLTKNPSASILAALIYSLTPLGIYYQRRVLLDNIMIMWLLFSFYLLIGVKRKLSRFIVSGVAFGLAFLSKEAAIFFLPALIYITYSQAHKIHKDLAVVKWIAVAFSVISVYVLYATLKGELFPTGTLLGGDKPHVSLLETLAYQASRSGEGNFLNPNGAFQWNLRTHWLKKDALIIILGIVGTLVSSVFAIKSRSSRYITVMTLSYWAYLMRGGIVIEFYVIPLIPFLAMSIAVSTHETSSLLSKKLKLKFTPLALFMILLLLFLYSYKNKTDIYTDDQTSHQVAAVEWLKKNIPQDSIVLIDNYAYVDMHSRIPNSVYIQKGAEYYWKADKDPDIKIEVLKNDWRNIDYILASDQMKYDINHAELDLVKRAYENSTLIKNYTGYGYDIEIRKVNRQ